MVFALALSLALAAPADELRLVIVSGARLRAEPTTTGDILTKIPVGTVIECREVRGDWCSVRAGDLLGWLAVSLTEPVAVDREAQLRALIDRKLDELGVTRDPARRPDVYEFHRFLLRRIDAAATPEAKARARLDELRLLRANPDAFHADKRVYRDEAQGWRLDPKALDALVEEARGTPVAEEAAWLRVQHGHNFECEGYAPCVLQSLEQIECRYLAQFPSGAHKEEALARIEETLGWLRDFQKDSEQPVDNGLELLAKVRQCLVAAGAPTATADKAQKALELKARKEQ